MAYSEVTESSTATPGQWLYDAVAAVLGAIAGWTKVDTYVTASGTWHVWKSLGTTNGLHDFHVGFWVNTAGTFCHLSAFEGYNVATRSYSRPCARTGTTRSTATSTPASADGSYGGGTEYALSTTATPAQTASNLTSPSLYAIGLPSTPSVTMTRRINITDKFIALGVQNGTSGFGYYVGLFDTLMPNPADDPVRLVCVDLANADNSGVSSADFGAFSRHPYLGGTVNLPFGAAVNFSGAAQFSKLIGYPGGSANDRLQGGSAGPARAIGSRAVIWVYSTSGAAVVGAMRGLLHDVVLAFGPSVGAGLALGDVTQVNGVSYVCVNIGTSSGYSSIWLRQT